MLFSQIKEGKIKFLILANSCTSRIIEYMKKINILGFVRLMKKYDVLNNKTVVSDHANLLHFDERSVYFK